MTFNELGERYADALADNVALQFERDRLQEALTPSAETKAAYMHEFRMTIPDVGDDGAEYTRTVNIPWTTIKEIIAAIRNRANNEGASR